MLKHKGLRTNNILLDKSTQSYCGLKNASNKTICESLNQNICLVDKYCDSGNDHDEKNIFKEFQLHLAFMHLSLGIKLIYGDLALT